MFGQSIEDDIKRITLEKVTFNDFEKLKNYRGSNILFRDDTEYAIVSNPLIWEITDPEHKEISYQELIKNLLEHPFTDQINVRKYYSDHPQDRRKKWIQRYKRQLLKQKDQVELLAANAIEDKRKINYFEIKFGVPPMSEEEREKRATIEFAERGNWIIGYDIYLFHHYRDLFTIDDSINPYKAIQGLWVPEDYAKDAGIRLIKEPQLLWR